LFAVLFVTSILCAGHVTDAKLLQNVDVKDAHIILDRAVEAVRIPKAASKILHYHSMLGNAQDYQSDRTYPPFFSALSSSEVWFDPQSGTERFTSRLTFPGTGPTPESTNFSSAQALFAVRDSKIVPTPGSPLTYRRLNAWAVLLDWQRSPDVTVVGHEMYRDYQRIVLSRKVNQAEERLYLDTKTWFPVKVDLTEKHYLWGQVHVEYVYSTWVEADGVFIPGATFRIVDGETSFTQTIGDAELKDPSATPSLTVPEAPKNLGDPTPLFLQPIAPKTVKVSENTYLLVNPGYTEAVSLIDNKIYVFDATQSEARAKQDDDLIQQLFPGKHEVFVVVTDLAWPHIAGVRYWVASGATIISHRISRDFLTKVIDRKWTLSPDTLEKSRGKWKFKFIPVEDSYAASGEKLKVFPIDGIASEGALMAYLSEDKFLWASDYIQDIKAPTLYAAEVIAATRRFGIEPEQAAAEHIPLTPWKTIRDVQMMKDER